MLIAQLLTEDIYIPSTLAECNETFSRAQDPMAPAKLPSW